MHAYMYYTRVSVCLCVYVYVYDHHDVSLFRRGATIARRRRSSSRWRPTRAAASRIPSLGRSSATRAGTSRGPRASGRGTSPCTRSSAGRSSPCHSRRWSLGARSPSACPRLPSATVPEVVGSAVTGAVEPFVRVAVLAEIAAVAAAVGVKEEAWISMGFQVVLSRNSFL